MPWDRVDAEVERLEHVVSEDLVNRLEEALGYPEKDPHGSPIPDRQGNLPVEDDSKPLPQLESGCEIVVRRVRDAEPGALQYLAEHGVVPGALWRFLRLEPYEGPYLLEALTERASVIAIGRPLAARIYVELR